MGLNQFYHKNSAQHLFGDDKMFNFTKTFERKRLVVRKQIRSQWSNSTIICICTIAYEDYIIFLCLSSLPSILCCLHAFPTSKHDAVYETVCKMALFTMLFSYLNFFPRLIFIYLQNVNKKRNYSNFKIENFGTPICNLI